MFIIFQKNTVSQHHQFLIKYFKELLFFFKKDLTKKFTKKQINNASCRYCDKIIAHYK